MSYLLLFGLCLFASSSLILITYHSYAESKGLPQGLDFISGKTFGKGWAGITFVVGIALYKIDLGGLMTVAGLSFFILVPLILYLLKENAQIYAVTGFGVGFFISLVAN
jgi:hypothetical protein